MPCARERVQAIRVQAMRDARAHGERVQAMRVPHARKRVQNARAHRVLQENAYKNARAHGENEWKGPPPL